MRHFLILLVLALSFAANAHAQSPISPIRISMSTPLTGKYSELGDMQMKGYKLWEHDVNDRGGILGRPVHLTVIDDKSDPALATDLYTRFIVEDKTDLVFAPYSSELTDAVASITEKYAYPMLAAGAGAEGLWQHGYRYLFGVINRVNTYTVSFLEIAVSKGLSTIAIIGADDMASKELSKGAQAWAKRFGLNVVFTEEFKKGLQQLDPLVQRAQASNAQVFIVCGHFEESINARLAQKRLGWVPRAYYATVGPLLPKYYDTLKVDAEATFSSSVWEPNANFPGADVFTDRFHKTYHKLPSYHAAAGYAGGQIMEAAIRKAGSLDREKIRENLSSLDILTILGRYGVDNTGKQIRQFSSTVQWQNGKKQIVAPEGMMTAKPIWK
jgi:branched-chain amino acid transport system substrate-binding protein